MAPFQSFSYPKLQQAMLNHLVPYSNHRHLQQSLNLPSLISSSPPQLFHGVQNPSVPTPFGAYNPNEVVGNPEYSHNNIAPAVSAMYPNQAASHDLDQYRSLSVGDMADGYRSVNPNQRDQPFLWKDGYVMKQAVIPGQNGGQLSSIAAQNDILNTASAGVVDDKKKKVQVRKKVAKSTEGQTPITRQKSQLWTHEEDAKLKILVRWVVGRRKWALIAKVIPGRKGKQCRERWLNYLRPNTKTLKNPWSREEEVKFINAHRKLGNKWSQISLELPGRSENDIKNRWNATKRKQQNAKNNGNQTVTSSPFVNYVMTFLAPANPAAAAAKGAAKGAGTDIGAGANQPHAAEAVHHDRSIQDLDDLISASTNIGAAANQPHAAEAVHYDRSIQDLDDLICASTDIGAAANQPHAAEAVHHDRSIQDLDDLICASTDIGAAANQPHAAEAVHHDRSIQDLDDLICASTDIGAAANQPHAAEADHHDGPDHLSIQELEELLCVSTDIFAKQFEDERNYSLFSMGLI